jgi:hypothetical protein
MGLHLNSHQCHNKQEHNLVVDLELNGRHPDMCSIQQPRQRGSRRVVCVLIVQFGYPMYTTTHVICHTLHILLCIWYHNKQSQCDLTITLTLAILTLARFPCFSALQLPTCKAPTLVHAQSPAQTPDLRHSPTQTLNLRQ